MAKKENSKKATSYVVCFNGRPILKNGKFTIKRFFSFSAKIKNASKVVKAKKLKPQNFYVTKKVFNPPKKLLVVVFGLIIGFINGFWGGGGGMLCVPTLSGVFKLNQKSSQATALLVMLPLSISSFIIYMTKGNLEFNNIWLIISGFFVGGIIGALMLKKMNNIFLKIVFGVIIIVAGVRLLL